MMVKGLYRGYGIALIIKYDIRIIKNGIIANDEIIIKKGRNTNDKKNIKYKDNKLYTSSIRVRSIQGLEECT